MITVAILHLLLSIIGLHTALALAILQVVIFSYGYVVSRRFIFKQSKGENYVYSPKSQAARYAFCMLCFRTLDGGISYILIDWLGLSYFVVPLMVSGVFFILKYFVYRKFVFKVV